MNTGISVLLFKEESINLSLISKKFRWCMPILIATALTACQSDEAAVPAPPSVSIPESTPQPEAVPEETVKQPAYTASLTGLEVKQPDTSRPIAVMINNAPAARPQSGLSQADMVYEVLAEGGITRLVAVYQSYHGDVTIGPVRSIRPYLIGIGDSLHALLVHAGGSTDAYAILQGGGREHLDEITNASAPFWRDSSRKAPHNLYTNEVKLREAAAKKGYEETVTIPAFPFLAASSEDNRATGSSGESTDAPATNETSGDTTTDATETTASGHGASSQTSSAHTTATATASTSTDHESTSATESSNSSSSASDPAASETSLEKANTIELRFLLQSYKVGYIYNAKTGLYTRQINGKDHIDLNNKKPLTAANVIVLEGNYRVLDDIGRLSLNLNAGGEAVLFQQGKVVRGEWKHSKDDAIRFYSEGKEVPLVAGTTYYNIVPNTPSFNDHLTIDGEKWD